MDNHERKRHQKETRANCMVVRVTGFGSAVRMALEEAFERIDEQNQTPQSIWYSISNG